MPIIVALGQHNSRALAIALAG